jgi:hypothetical protein
MLAGMAAAIGELIDQNLSVPSLGGPTGIVSLPNAITAPARTWQVALSYQGMQASSSGMYEDRDDFGAWSVQTAHRLSDTEEAWASYSCTTNHPGSHAWGFGGKKMLTRLEGGGPFAAVGASYHRWGDAFGGEWSAGNPVRPDADVVNAYAVVTGDLSGESWLPVLGTAGVAHTRLNLDGGRSRSTTRPFVGVQAICWGTVLGLEYRWKDPSVDAKPVFSAAIRQVLSDEVTIEAGTTNASPVGTGLSAQRLFVRVNRCF